jgi:hypothetical protein
LSDNQPLSIVNMSWYTVPKPIAYRYVWHYDDLPDDLHVAHFSATSLSSADNMLRDHVAQLNPGKVVSITVKSIDSFG